MKTIEYPLMATSFSEEQLKELVRPLLKTALPMARVQRKLARDLVCGTLQSRGLDIQNPYHTQLIHHLQAILRHQQRDTPSRDLMEDNMDAVQTHVGSEINFWELPHQDCSWMVPEGWMKNTWEALSKTPITLSGVNLALPKQRSNDQYLMDVFIGCGRYDPHQLQQLQDCRLFLRATTLSDISNAQGDAIHTNAWLGKPMTHLRARPWIHTYKPGKNAWDMWRQALRDHFLPPYAPHQSLTSPLGQWRQRMDDTWRWWYKDENTLLEHTDDQGWMVWTRQTDRGRFGDATPQVGAHPALLRRADVNRYNDSPHVYFRGIGTHQEHQIQPSDTLLNTLQKLPPTASWALDHVLDSNNGNTIARAIQQNNAIAVSDGSYKDGFGTAACVIEGETKRGRIRGTNVVPGPIKDGDSHRCELAGLYAIILFVNAICQTHNIHQGSITVACDNMQALQIFHPDFLPDPSAQNFDMVHAVWTQMKTNPIKWNGVHVKGHQDSRHLYGALTRMELLNIEMDALAKDFWHHCCVHNPGDTIPSPPSHDIYGEGWQLHAHNKKIAHPSTRHLYSIIQDPHAQHWWVEHGQIPEAATPEVDWDASTDFMQKLDANERRWITKHSSDNCGVNATLTKWRYKTDAGCPKCGQEEDTAHVYQCQGYSSTSPWDGHMEKLSQYMDRTQTSPQAQDAILMGIRKWRQKAPIPLDSFNEDVKTVVRQQNSLGWKNLIEGLPVKGWQNLQRHYYTLHNIRRSSKKWVRGLLQQLFRAARQQWKHRNDVKHRILKPEYTAAMRLLNREIRRELLQGTRRLLPGDRHLVQRNMMELLSRKDTYKQSWYVSIIEARKRGQAQYEYTRNQSTLYRWLSTKQPVS